MSTYTYEQRITVLDRMSKRELLALNRHHYPNAWTAHPLETWDRMSLMSRILDAEFPHRTAVCAACRCKPCMCSLHTPSEVCDCPNPDPGRPFHCAARRTRP